MDLFDMPDYEHTEDESFPPLPPPLSPGQGGDDNPFGNGEEGEVSQLAEVPAAKRKGVRRPQPKLDSNRLVSERGLPALRTLFDNVHFKGKGHETEDLRLLMHKMENWAHRLYPKMQFENFIDKVEKLGAKKDVQTCVKRIRLDMPLTHEDFIGKDGEEDMGERRDEQDFGEPDPFGGVFLNEPQGPVHSTPAPAFPRSTPAPTPAPAYHSTPASSSSAPSLTEEQRQRMERNKQLALEKRLARKQHLQQQQTDMSASQPVSSNVTAEEPSTSSSQRENQAENMDQGRQAEDVDQASVQAQDVNLEDQAKDMDQNKLGHQAEDVDQGPQATDVDQGPQATDVDQGDQASDQDQAEDMDQGHQATDVDQGHQATDVDQGEQATDVDQGAQAAAEKQNQSSSVEGAFKPPHKDSLLPPGSPPCGAVPQLSNV